MSNDKYELTNESIMVGETKLYRIKALKDISFKYVYSIKAGCLGGYVESETNLSHDGDSWIANNACVYGDAQVYGDAIIAGNAQVYGDAQVYNDAQVYGNAIIAGFAKVYGSADVSGYAKVYGSADVSGYAKVYGRAGVSGHTKVYGNAHVYENAQVYGDAQVYGNAHVYENAHVYDNACVYGNARVYGKVKVGKDALILSTDDYATISGFGRKNRTTTFYLSHNNIIMVDCGCFNGDITEFRERVKVTHDTSSLGVEYAIIANLMEMRFERILLNR